MIKTVDLREKFKIGDLIAETRKDGNKNILAVYRVTKFPYANWKPPQYDMLYARLIRVKHNNGKWFKDDGTNTIVWKGDVAFGYSSFGVGKVHKYRGKI